MKRAISLMLALALCLGLCACGGEQSSSATTTPTEPVVKLAIGEKAATDLAEFTLENSTFTYYVSNSSSNYVEATDTPNTLYAASIGHCYVSLTFTIKNKDRGGSISFAGSFSNEWNPKFMVSYNGSEYPVKGFDLNNNAGRATFDLGSSAVVNKETGKVIEKHSSGNYLLSAGEEVTLRAFGIIDVDPTNLTDGFELTVQVPNSNKAYEHFTYVVPAHP